MLGDLERKLMAMIGDGLAARPHIHVGPPPSPQPTAGNEEVTVSLVGITPEASFVPGAIGRIEDAGGPRSRRILPLAFAARIGFLLRPAAPNANALGEGRATLLDDMSLVAHMLTEGEVRTGGAFATAAPDPGFRVLAFQLAEGTVEPQSDDGLVSGRLDFQGRAEVWPAGVSAEEGTIRAIDALVAALPLSLRVKDPAVRTGSATEVLVRPPGKQRLVDPVGGARQPLRLAVRVVSDLPPDQRGTIATGAAGIETGVRLIEASAPEIAIAYQAPAGSLGATRVEYVAVHLATADGRTGLFLGSAAVPLLPGAP